MMSELFGNEWASRRTNPRKDGSKSRLILTTLDALRPTQVAVGMQAVNFQRGKLERRVSKQKRLDDVLERRPIPAVRGPGGELYMIDRHHFALALCHADINRAFAYIVDDLSHLTTVQFWHRMERTGRLFLFDEDGRRVSPHGLPKNLVALRHDPFRDLAWEVREAGGFEKSQLPFAEFRWANFFRRNITKRCVRSRNSPAFGKAMSLCQTDAAANLPGFICQ